MGIRAWSGKWSNVLQNKVRMESRRNLYAAILSQEIKAEVNTEILICVSDLHCGSDVGLATPETKTKSGNIIGFGENYHQEWLWDNWISLISQAKEIIGTSESALLINGDATDGVHHRNEASLLAALIETHTEIAKDALKSLLDICSKKFVTLGTECHTKHQEDVLAEKIGAETGKARNEWLLEINGCLIDAKHHMSTTGRAYLEASAMSILMGNARLERVRAGHRIPQVYLRAHRHCGGFYSDGSGLFGVTGAWQFLTRQGFKVVPDSIPKPSVLILDWRGKKLGSLPVVHELKAIQPQSEIHVA